MTFSDVFSEDRQQPPVGRYPSTYGYMELGTDSVTFFKKVLFQKEIKQVVPYIQIARVEFSPAHGLGRGFLSIREFKDINKPLATLQNAATDATSTDFISNLNNQMQQVYSFFQNCAAHNQSSIPNIPSPDKEPKRIEVGDLEYYYQKHHPNRDAAVMAMRVDMGLNSLEAKKYVDLIFDFHEKRDGIEAFRSKNDLHCPQCESNRVCVEKKGFDYAAAWFGERLLPGIGFLIGGIGSDKRQCECLTCGHKWEL